MLLHRVRRGGLVVLLLLSVVAGAFTAAPRIARAEPVTFRNGDPIEIRDNDAANPYPSPIVVSGLTGVTSKVTVKLYSMTHPNRSDVDIMLVAPTGQAIMLFSDDSGEFAGVDITFADDAPLFPNDDTLTGDLSSQPVNYFHVEELDDDVFPSPAPSTAPATTFEEFSGKDPNGQWRLFVRDDTGSGNGTIGGGWDLNIETAPSVGGNTITIPLVGSATPYASTINITGGYGVDALRVTLFDINHTNPDDLDALLVGPGGQAVRLMSDAGGRDDLIDTTLSFSDNAAKRLPDQTRIKSGNYKPSNFGATDAFPAPAPAAPFSTTLSGFNGTAADGVWSLYVHDDLGGYRGSIGGWALGGFNTGGFVLTEPFANQVVHPGSTMVLTSEFSDPDGDTIQAVSPSMPTFGNLQWSFTGVTVTFFPEVGDVGTHTASITLNDGFHLTTHTFTITVPDSGIAGSLSIPAAGVATPYPSTIEVSGLTGVIADVTVAINNISHGYLSDVEMMLVGPTGVAVELLSDCYSAPVSGATYTFSDAGGSFKGVSGSHQPKDCQADTDAFPAPAPSIAASGALSALDGTTPNGTWSLYVLDDEAPDGGTIGSWSLGIDTNTPPTVRFPKVVRIGAGDTTEITLTANDADEDSLTWSVTNQPSFMTLTDNGDGVATMELNTDRFTSGDFRPTVSVSDGFSTTSKIIVIAVVREDDTPPTVSSSVSPLPPASGWQSSSVTVTLSALDDESGVQDIVYMAIGAQPIGSTSVESNSTQVEINQEGYTTIYFSATDNELNTSITKTRGVKIDSQAPTVTAPLHSLVNGSQIQPTTMRVAISWSGADVGLSGLERFILQQSTAGGAFTIVTLPSLTATSITLDLTHGTFYQFRVRAVDMAGNASSFVTGDVFRTIPRQENGGGGAYSTSPAWTVASQTQSYGGTVRRADTLDATVTVGFNGSQIAWISTLCPSCGMAEVSIDGTVVGAVDLYGATGQFKTIVFVSDRLPDGPHTLRVRVLGAHSAGTGNRVDIDGFAIFPVVN